MTIDKTEDSIVEGKLDHHTTFPAIAKHVLHDVVFADISQEAAVVLLDENGEEDLSLAHEVNLDVPLAQVAVNQLDFLLFLAATLLTAKSNDIIAFVVGEERLEVDGLRLARMVPRDCEDVEGDVAEDQVPHRARLVLLI